MNKAAILAAGLAAVLLGGCGAEPQRADIGLEEPPIPEESYYTVRSGSVGQLHVERATVVPMEYGQFLQTAATVEEILVRPGDKVQKGDPIARLRTGEIQKRCEALKHERGLLDAEHEIDEQLHAYNRRLYALSEWAARESGRPADSGETAGDAAYRTQLALEAEEERYGTLLYRYRREKLTEQLDRLTPLTEDVVCADHDGIVSYVKNLLEDPEAEERENLAVIADWSDPYLELDEVTIRNNPYADAGESFVQIDGMTYPVKERPYPAETLADAYALVRYPNAAYSFPEEAPLGLGDRCVVFFREQAHPVRLLVPDACIRYTGEQAYVSVRTDAGSEARAVTLGDGDSNYVEVTDGLREGEQISYHTVFLPPEGLAAETLTLRQEDLYNDNSGSEETSGLARYAVTAERLHEAAVGGTVTCVYAKQGDEVEAGQLLLAIDTEIGQARQTELSYLVRDAEEAIRDAGKSYRQQQEALGREESSDALRTCRLGILRLQHQKEMLRLDEALREAQEAYQSATAEADSSGVAKIYAQESGQLGRFAYREGDRVQKGEVLYGIRIRGGELLQVMFYAKAVANASRESEGFVSLKDRLTGSSIPRGLLFREPLEEEKEISRAAQPVGELLQVRFSAQVPQRLPQPGQSVSVTIGGRTLTGVAVGYTHNTQRVYPQLSMNRPSGLVTGGAYIELKTRTKEDEKAVAAIAQMDITQGWHYSQCLAKGLAELPEWAVETERDAIGLDRQYVWQMVDGAWIKTYVHAVPWRKILEPFQGSYLERDMYLILSGLAEGDAVAQEREEIEK